MTARRRPAEGGGFLREIVLLRERVGDFTVYPYSIPAVGKLDRLRLDPAVTILIGENGSGKSTVIEAIAILAGLNPEGGTRNFRHAHRPSESSLWRSLRLVRNACRERSAFFLRAETMFNVATEVEKLQLTDYGWEDLHARSHGEAFLWLVEHRFRPHGLYVLDEPESALSPQRQLALLRHIHDLVRAGSQLVLATHSPILMAYPGATLYRLDEHGIARTKFRETEHYVVTRAFLEHPEAALEELFRDPEAESDAPPGPKTKRKAKPDTT